MSPAVAAMVLLALAPGCAPTEDRTPRRSSSADSAEGACLSPGSCNARLQSTLVSALDAVDASLPRARLGSVRLTFHPATALPVDSWGEPIALSDVEAFLPTGKLAREALERDASRFDSASLYDALVDAAGAFDDSFVHVACEGTTSPLSGCGLPSVEDLLRYDAGDSSVTLRFSIVFVGGDAFQRVEVFGKPTSSVHVVFQTREPLAPRVHLQLLPPNADGPPLGAVVITARRNGEEPAFEPSLGMRYREVLGTDVTPRDLAELSQAWEASERQNGPRRATWYDGLLGTRPDDARNHALDGLRGRARDDREAPPSFGLLWSFLCAPRDCAEDELAQAFGTESLVDRTQQSLFSGLLRAMRALPDWRDADPSTRGLLHRAFDATFTALAERAAQNRIHQLGIVATPPWVADLTQALADIVTRARLRFERGVPIATLAADVRRQSGSMTRGVLLHLVDALANASREAPPFGMSSLYEYRTGTSVFIARVGFTDWPFTVVIKTHSQWDTASVYNDFVSDFGARALDHEVLGWGLTPLTETGDLSYLRTPGGSVSSFSKAARASPLAVLVMEDLGQITNLKTVEGLPHLTVQRGAVLDFLMGELDRRNELEHHDKTDVFYDAYGDVRLGDFGFSAPAAAPQSLLYDAVAGERLDPSIVSDLQRVLAIDNADLAKLFRPEYFKAIPATKLRARAISNHVQAWKQKITFLAEQGWVLPSPDDCAFFSRIR